MATIVNARDVQLQATSPRMQTVSLGSNTTVDFSNVNGSTKPSDNADVTVTVVNGGLVLTSGGITMSGGGSVKGGQTAFDTGTGFFLGYSSTTYKFSIGNSSGNKLTWDGSNLAIVGNISGASNLDVTGTGRFNGSSGTIGGSSWTVTVNDAGNIRGGLYARGGSSIAGVYGTSDSGIGVMGETTSTSSSNAVYGHNQGTGGAAGSFVAENSNARAVDAFHNVNSGTNSGYALRAQGRYTQTCSGTSDIGMYVETRGSSSGAAQFFNYLGGSSTSKEFWAAPGSYAAYSPSGKGKYYFPDGAGPFTGFHPAFVARDCPDNFEVGDIVVDEKMVMKEDISNVVGTARLSSKPNQRGVLGVVNEIKDITIEFTYEQFWTFAPDYKLMDVNALGEGQINVCGEGGDIELGDLLVSSSIPGKGMKQQDDIVRSYTVAKAREPVTFSSPSEVKQIACIYLAG
jgi:hypothetical protein